MRKHKKGVIDAVLLLVLIAITAYFTLDDQNINNIIDTIQDAEDSWLILAIGFVFVFVCGESVIMKYLYKVLGTPVKILQCIKYSFVGFFFSLVTPSATGGQPMQLYYMGKDNHKISESALVLLIITIGYKAALLVMSGIAFISQGEFILIHLDYVAYLLIYGVIVNVLFIAFLMMLIFREEYTHTFIRWITGGLGKLHLIRNVEAFQSKVFEMMQPYRQGAGYLKKHKNVFFHVLWMSILQRSALFLVTWCVYKSFGLSGISMLKIVALQTIISLSVDMLPLPGGVGVSEKSFEIMFDVIFGASLVIPGMILSRGISFYLLVVVTGIVTVLQHAVMVLKERKNMSGK